jgi:hypothetical protein
VLPRRYAGFSSCFRREAGTYGKDTRGIFRVHQFDKVEMFSYAHPERSWDEHEAMLAIEESIVGGLGLPYRVIAVAAGDLGAPAAKKYDIEVWLPSEGRYRELTSCSNYTDYSARRLGARMKGEGGTRLLHTLNGTACAVGRTLLFLFEHYQDEGGALAVPDVLRPYTGFATGQTTGQATGQGSRARTGRDGGPVNSAGPAGQCPHRVELHAQGSPDSCRCVPLSATNREDLAMLATPLLFAFALGLLVPLGSRVGGRGEAGTFLAVTFTVLAVIAGFTLAG